MKTFTKVFALFLLCFGLIHSAEAQTPFTKESKIVHTGIGLGGYDIDLFTGSASPLITVSYDQGLIDDLGIGNLGIGGAVGAKFYNFGSTTYNRIFIAARGTYHFHFVNSENLDFYAGVTVGGTFYTGDRDTVFGFNGGPFGGPFAGINYWFSPNFGVYAEAGYAYGFINGGASFGF